MDMMMTSRMENEDDPPSMMTGQFDVDNDMLRRMSSLAALLTLVYNYCRPLPDSMLIGYGNLFSSSISTISLQFTEI